MGGSEKESGFGLIELILAVSLFAVLSAAGVSMTLGSLRLNRLGGEETNATFLAAEGIDAVRSIKKQGWTSPFLSTNCVAGCGVTSVSGDWVLSGTSDNVDKYTRKVFITQSQRDGLGNIVDSGGTNDVDTYKVTSQVSWNRGIPPISNTVTVISYLTNFMKKIGGNWANPSQESSINIPGNDDAVDLAVMGNYLFVLKPGTTSDLMVFDITNTLTPVLVGTLDLARVAATSIFISGNYLYVSDADNSAEMKIVDISNPLTPVLLSSFNAQGNSNANGVFVANDTAYISRSLNPGDPEFVTINVLNKSTPTLLGSLQLPGNNYDVSLLGNYAFVASSDNASELQIINVTNPAIPTLASSLNLSGNNDGLEIAAFGDTVIIGRDDGSVAIVDVTNKLTPILVATYAGNGGSVRGMSLGSDNKYLFLATTSTTQEIQIVDITNVSAPVLLSSINLALNNPSSIFYDATFDRAFVSTADNNNEVYIFQPL